MRHTLARVSITSYTHSLQYLCIHDQILTHTPCPDTHTHSNTCVSMTRYTHSLGYTCIHDQIHVYPSRIHRYTLYRHGYTTGGSLPNLSVSMTYTHQTQSHIHRACISIPRRSENIQCDVWGASRPQTTNSRVSDRLGMRIHA